MLKKMLIGIICLAFVACAGVGINLSDNTITILQQSATSTVGYLIAKNNPSHIDEITTWYQVFCGISELSDAQEIFQDGISQLGELVSDDPYLQLQIKNVLSLLEINIEGPQTIIELGKYRAVVDSFMAGVFAVSIQL